MKRKCSSYHSVTRAQGEILSVGGGEAAEVAEVDVAKHSLGRYFLLMVINFLTKKKKTKQQQSEPVVFWPMYILRDVKLDLFFSFIILKSK